MIKIITVGKIKKDYLKEGINDYLKRLSKYTKVELIELNDSDINTEKDLILKNIKEKDYIITTNIEAVQLSSIELSNYLTSLYNESISNITIIIGGSYGIHQDIIKKSNYQISFSKLTFPHQLFRIMLLEQLYRAYKIINNESYHK